MTHWLTEFRQYRRVTVLATTYAAIIAISFYLAYEVRFDFAVPAGYQAERLHYFWIILGFKIIGLLVAGQFGSMMTYFSIPDLFRLIWATTICSLVILALRVPTALGFQPPRGVVLVDYLFSLGGLCGVRIAIRIYRERITLGRNKPAMRQESIAIVGAGDAGALLASEFINAPSKGFKPIVFFDDDLSKYGKMIHGVPVAGPPELLNKPNQFSDIARIVVAMPKASARRVREIVLLAAKHQLKVETIPSYDELAAGKVKTSRIRPVEIEDLLGRESVKLDSDRIQKLIAGRVVLVTGSGGSIGSELCRQIAALNPKRLLMVEQSEGNLFTIEQEMSDRGHGALCSPLIADILDPQRMDFIFSRHRPEIVFHAAAHKHVYLMERQPTEAIANNVFGTRQMARLSAKYEVAEFVLISTDKAINPSSVMGATKRLAEIQLQIAQTECKGKTKFIAVRFGNVLGSSGSVIPIFRRQISTGGPVTVTHPDVVRYFMTIPEAVGLVLQSGVMGRGGEIFVLDMGQPVKIADLARQMIELSGFRVGEDIEIKFVGLKPGEKLFEELQHTDEKHLPTEHPRVMRFTSSSAINREMLQELDAKLYQFDQNELKSMLQRLVPEYTPYFD